MTHLAQTAERIASTPSRSEKIAHLATYLQTLNNEDLARATREPVGTVKSRLCRGRAHLRNALGLDAAIAERKAVRDIAYLHRHRMAVDAADPDR